MRKQLSLIDFLLIWVGIFSPLCILQVSRIAWSIILLIAYMVAIILSSKKIVLFSIRFYSILGFLSIITMTLNLMSGMGGYWKRDSFYNGVLYIILLCFAVFGARTLSILNIFNIVKGLKIGCITNIVWGYIQVGLYYLLGVDINNIIFTQFLGLKEFSSAYRNGAMCMTGFGWHPGLLVPVIILSYCLFDSVIIKVLLIGVSLLSLNSTCVFAVIMCFTIDYFYNFIRKRKKTIKKKHIINVLCIVISLLILSISNRDIMDLAFNRVEHLFSRIFEVINSSSEMNISTYLHSRYYTYYLSILKNSSMWQTLFGYGYECSGYPFTIFLGQYISLKAWIVESDLMNFLIGRGIIWTVLHYVWLIMIAVKGMKVSYKYLIFILSVLICGILYNNQFYWVMWFEVLLYTCIKRDINLWEIEAYLRQNMKIRGKDGDK